MGAKMILTAKLVFVYAYSSVLAAVPGVMEEVTNRTPPDSIMWGLITLMFVPELMSITSKSFRDWIRRGIEDDDGKFNKSDLKDMMILYSSLWLLRVVLVWSWFHIFYGVYIEYSLYITLLAGSFGTAGLPILRSFVSKKRIS